MFNHFPVKSSKPYPTNKPKITPVIKDAVKNKQKHWSLNKQSFASNITGIS